MSPSGVSTAGAGLEAVARSHPGLVRSRNEDRWVCEPARGLFAVIDGMGGEAAGEVAAGLVEQGLLAWEPVGGPLREALHRAGEAIWTRAAAEPALRGMGAVATAVRVEGQSLQVAHVGDTRAYLARGRGVQQLTRDHTTAAAERDRLGLTDAEGRALPGQHRVTRDLGGQHHPDPSWIDAAGAPFEPGDILLLCSDGLHDLVTDDEILAHLKAARAEGRRLDALASALIDLALDRGGRDNVTVVCVRAGTAPAARSPAVPAATLPLPAWVLVLWPLSLLLAAVLGALLARPSAPPEPPAPAPRPAPAAPPAEAPAAEPAAERPAELPPEPPAEPPAP